MREFLVISALTAWIVAACLYAVVVLGRQAAEDEFLKLVERLGPDLRKWPDGDYPDLFWWQLSWMPAWTRGALMIAAVSFSFIGAVLMSIRAFVA